MRVPRRRWKVSWVAETPHGVSRDRGDVSDSPAARRGRFDWVTLGSAVVTVALTALLVFQLVLASLDSPQRPSAQEISGYWLTAAVMIGIQVALLIRATRLRRPGLQFISAVALIMAVGASLLLSVPQIDWKSDPPVHTTNPDYVPCYSGSGDCVGG